MRTFVHIPHRLACRFARNMASVSGKNVRNGLRTLYFQQKSLTTDNTEDTDREKRVSGISDPRYS